MPSIFIDGQECSYEGNPSVLQVALDNGVEIPHYCYHPGLSVVASCRICLAEISQPNPRNEGKLELIPKLVPTCQTPAADGMVVHLKSPKTISNQKAVMEYLLINHPLDCPVCDQAGECSLQDYSYRYGRSASRFEETKIKQPKKDLGPNVLLYSDRCIMCTRCARFTKEVTGTKEIGIFGRGSMEQIDVFPGVPLDNELSGNVVDICPVGALLDKDFLMTMRVWNLQKTPSIDGLTASGDNLSIEANDGKVYRVKPRTNMEVNKWWISDQIRYGWKFVHDVERLRSPLWRAAHNAGQEECDWNQAYGRVAERFGAIVRERGQGSLGLMVSPMLPSEEAFALGRAIQALDPGAVLAVGPVPVDGENKTFPGGYTLYAEKAPNARGVRRALELLTDQVLDAAAFQNRLPAMGGALLCGGYPSEWSTPTLRKAAGGLFTVVLDILPSDLALQADVVLPGATWMEKSGCFENIHGRLQAFDAAIPVIELAKTEGQIAMDLLAAFDATQRGIFDAAALRVEMGDRFASDVHLPEGEAVIQSDIQYVEL